MYLNILHRPSKNTEMNFQYLIEKSKADPPKIVMAYLSYSELQKTKKNLKYIMATISLKLLIYSNMKILSKNKKLLKIAL